MALDQKTQILTSWCATSHEVADIVFPGLIVSNPETDDGIWRDLLETIAVPRLMRMLSMVRSGHLRGLTPIRLDMSRLTFDNSQARWNGQLIGKRHTYYKTVLPYEAQARAAHDIFLDRFINFIGKQYKAVVLQQSDLALELFVPGPGFELESVWLAFVATAFSTEALKRYFAPLVNTIRMTDQGFSALGVPIVSREQAKFLAAFYVVNLRILQKGDAKRVKEIREEQQKLSQASEDLERIEKKIAKIESELQSRLARYEPLYQQVEELREKYPRWMHEVEFIANSAFTPTAGVQISKAAAKITKCIAQLEDLVNPKLYQIPPLLTSKVAQGVVRRGGDDNTKICYGCGRQLDKKEPVYPVSKFIFESPAQRLQSGGSQTQPNVCGVCAAISFVSPVKLGGGRVIVRMREAVQDKAIRKKQPEPSQARYLIDEQLRMLVLGEMNLVAGKYVILKADEKIAGELVSDRLGRLQYALYKVSALFEPEVFEAYEVEVFIDTEVTLVSRHLVWLNWLNTVFEFRNCFDRALVQPGNRTQFAAFGRAIRYVQKEEVLFAIYELLKAELINLPPDMVKANQLEQLRKEHVRWLKMDGKNQAQFYEDVAAMTGLLYAFCSYVRGEVRKAGGNERIEVSKVIERSDDPYRFDYTVANNTRRELATLYRQSDMYFSYDRLKLLLATIGVDVSQREAVDEKEQLTLRLYFDDVVSAYAYLCKERYKTTKEQRDFTYALKLSLYARFPDLITSDKGKGK